MKDDLQKSDSCGLKSERKKILTSSTCSLACLSTNLGAFCPMVVHLPSEKSILPYFSGPRGVAILDCDSHSQAGSTSFNKNSTLNGVAWVARLSQLRLIPRSPRGDENCNVTLFFSINTKLDKLSGNRMGQYLLNYCTPVLAKHIQSDVVWRGQ